MAERYQNRIELLQGTLDLLILQTLLWGEQHGYGISQVIRAQTGDVLQVDTGSLYPALHKLEHNGWKRAKFYRLTATGRKQLAEQRSRWEQISQAIAAVLQTPKTGSEV